MSRSMSPLSRAIFMRTLQIPAEAESDLCDDPFNLHLPTSNFSSESTGEINESLWGMGNSSAIKRKLASFVQPCESSCLKAVLESKHKKIYLRGCLTSMYKQISARDYHFTMPPIGSCDEQQDYSQHMGASVTQTCLCSSNFCNSTSATQWKPILFLICILTLLI
uniref:Protein sleepless n=1 Tax=Panagrolaimus sp. JU765 TaxID=591449 RepID=A0AC34Q2T5_9BILA